MEKNQKRRRKACPKCGKSFSYTWSKIHVQECGLQEVERSDKVTDTGLDQIPPNITQQFCDLMEKERFMEEDASFFENDTTDNDQDVEEIPEDNDPEDNSTPCTPPTETWDNEEVEEYFRDMQDAGLESDHESSSMHITHGEDNSSPTQAPLPEMSSEGSSKIDALILWVVLFISTWQSDFGISETALSTLIKFLCKFFWLIGTFDTTMCILAKRFPGTSYQLKKMLGLMEDNFKKFVVCPKCKSIYNMQDCITRRSGNHVSARCSFVPWPSHPHRSRRGKQTILLRSLLSAPLLRSPC